MSTPVAVQIHRNALAPGSTLQEYRVESVLGAGGFGITYLCHDTHLDKRVAIKEYFPAELVVRALDGGVLPVQDEDAEPYRWGLARFLQEARTLARFSHPHIVRVNRYFEAQGSAYMVMDYEAGQSLNQALRSGGPMDEARARQVIAPLLEGLQAVHDTGFLHRDIKPSNVFLRASGAPVLLDFGSARQALGGSTRTLTSIITPGYAPLEQYAEEGHQGPWTDIYALGGVMLRALSGENPPDAVSRLQRDSVPERLAQLRGRVSPGGLQAIEWALVLEARSRPQSVAEWRRVLEGRSRAPLAARAPTEARVPARPAAPVRRDAPEARSPWRWVGAAAAALLLFGAGNQWMRLRGAASPADTPLTQAPVATPIATVAAPEATPATLVIAPSPKQLPPGPADGADPGPGVANGAGPSPSGDVAGAPPAAAEPTSPPFAQGRPLPGPVVAGPPDREAEFQRLDRNRDGHLSLDEVRELRRVAEAFGAIDRDGNGFLSKDEWLSFRLPGPPMPPGAGARLPPRAGGEGPPPPITR